MRFARTVFFEPKEGLFGLLGARVHVFLSKSSRMSPMHKPAYLNR